MKTVSKFSTEHSEPTCRDGARARRVRPEPHAQNAFLIRVIREIRGFIFGTRLKSLLIHLGVASLRSRILPALIAVLSLLPAGRVTAQTFTTLHIFTGGSDGGGPDGDLILSGKTLYGTAGTVFKVNTDGTGFTNLNVGAGPGGLILSGNTLYGTSRFGGSYGTVFAVNTDGTGFTNLHSFTATSHNTNSDGASPRAGLVLSGNALYGTAWSGGSSHYGTLFAINTDGSGFTTLHTFNGDDGANPEGGLILAGNTLYGTAAFGGSSCNGTVFAVNADGTGFTNLHSFTETSIDNTDPNFPVYVNSDGAWPQELILSGNTLYGTAYEGGRSGYGTVFALNTNGTGFANLHSFTAPTTDDNPFFPTLTNSDGAYPLPGLVLSGNTLYGTTGYGGSWGFGTEFAVHTDGTGFTNLGSLADNIHASFGLILGNTLYGTTYAGPYTGVGSGYGPVFSFSFPPPQLTISPSGANVILSWPTNVAWFDYTGFTLQSTTNLGSPTVWSTNSPAPVVIAGQNTVTNPITGPQQFYRLIQ